MWAGLLKWSRNVHSIERTSNSARNAYPQQRSETTRKREREREDAHALSIMSYNPAFVSDESPLAGSLSADDDRTSGIKLTSFKPLPSAAQNQSVVLDLSGQGVEQAGRRPAKQVGPRCSGSQQVCSPLAAAAGGQANGPIQAKQARASVNNSGIISTSKARNSSNFCTSTSSSLSLIDNPTLSSLTPSASSYSTTNSSSSIVSSSGMCAAVECRDMRYDVGRGKNQKTILYNINVTVPEGSIYGLLGPSGCGKTTMLRCVVGRIKPKEGFVRVFGYEPNDSGSQIPGPAIGYMPQVSSTRVAGWVQKFLELHLS